MAKRYSHSERQQHLDTWKQSGLTKQHYCQQHGLNPATFYYWLKHHRDDATVDVPAAFIPVRRVMPGNNDADTVTLNLPNGCSVRCRPASQYAGGLVRQQTHTAPNSGLRKALDYTLKRWPALLRYLDDGRVPIDNNRTENCIRPVAVGRKNGLCVSRRRTPANTMKMAA